MNHDRSEETIVFQVGLDRCGTTSLLRLFNHSGYHAIRFHYRMSNVYNAIWDNIIHSRPPIAEYKFETVKFFGDIKNFFSFNDVAIEQKGYYLAPIFEHWYPNAKFILNKRNIDDWIDSKLGVTAGIPDNEKISLLNSLGFSNEKSFRDYMKSEYQKQLSYLRCYFSGDKSKKMIEFDIIEDDIDIVIDFLKPDFELKKEEWKKYNSSEEVRRKIDRGRSHWNL